MGNDNGKNTKLARNTRRLAKIVFGGPIEDAFGKPQTELYEDEADWHLVVDMLRVPMGPSKGAGIIGAPPAMQVMPVPVPMYEIVQQAPGDDRQFVMWHVPVAQVRYVRMPHEIVEVRDARGDVVDSTPVWASKADELRAKERAALERGEAAER
jgi:hypothetical protein